MNKTGDNACDFSDESELVEKLIDALNEADIPCDFRTGIILISMGVTALRASGHSVELIKRNICTALDRSVVIGVDPAKKAN